MKPLEQILRELWAIHGPISATQARRISMPVYRRALQRYGGWYAALKEADLPWKLAAPASGRWSTGRAPMKLSDLLPAVREHAMRGAPLRSAHFPDNSLYHACRLRLGGWPEALLLAGVPVECLPQTGLSRGATALAAAQLASRGFDLAEDVLARCGYLVFLRSLWLHFRDLPEALKESTWLPLSQSLLSGVPPPELPAKRLLGMLRVTGGVAAEVDPAWLEQTPWLKQCLQRYWPLEAAARLAEVSLVPGAPVHSSLARPDPRPPGMPKALTRWWDHLGPLNHPRLELVDSVFYGMLRSAYGTIEAAMDAAGLLERAPGAPPAAPIDDDRLTLARAVELSGAPARIVMQAIKRGELTWEDARAGVLQAACFQRWLATEERLSCRAAATLLGIDRREVNVFIHSGELPATRVRRHGRGRRWLVRRADVVRFGEQLASRPPSGPSAGRIPMKQAEREYGVPRWAMARAVHSGELPARAEVVRHRTWYTVTREDVEAWLRSARQLPAEEGELLTLEQVARESGFAISAVRNFVAQGRLPALQVPFPFGKRLRYLVRRSDFDAWLQTSAPPRGAHGSEQGGPAVPPARAPSKTDKGKTPDWRARLVYDPAPPGWDEPGSGWLTTPEACARTGFNLNLLYRSIEKGHLKALTIRHRNRPVKLLRVEEVDALTADLSRERPGEGWLLTAEAAALAHVTPESIIVAIGTGALPARKEPKGRLRFRYRVDPAELERWAAERTPSNSLTLAQMVALTGLPAAILRQGAGLSARPAELEAWWRGHLSASGKDPGPEPLLLSARDCARRLKVTSKEVSQAVKQGRLRGFTVSVGGYPRLLVNRLSLEEFVLQEERAAELPARPEPEEPVHKPASESKTAPGAPGSAAEQEPAREVSESRAEVQPAPQIAAPAREAGDEVSLEQTLRDLWAIHGPIPPRDARRVAGDSLVERVVAEYGEWLAGLRAAGLPWKLAQYGRPGGVRPVRARTEDPCDPPPAFFVRSPARRAESLLPSVREHALQGASLLPLNFADRNLCSECVQALGGWPEALLLAGIPLECLPQATLSRNATALAAAQLQEREIDLSGDALVRSGYMVFLRSMWIHFRDLAEALEASAMLPLCQPLLSGVPAPKLAKGRVLGTLRIMGGVTAEVNPDWIETLPWLKENVERNWTLEQAARLAKVSLVAGAPGYSPLARPDPAPPGPPRALARWWEHLGSFTVRDMYELDFALLRMVLDTYRSWPAALAAAGLLERAVLARGPSKKRMAVGAGPRAGGPLSLACAVERSGAPLETLLLAVKRGELAWEDRRASILEATSFEHWLTTEEHLCPGAAADLLGTDPRTVSDLIQSGQLAGVRLRGRGPQGTHWRVRRADVLLYRERLAGRPASACSPDRRPTRPGALKPPGKARKQGPAPPDGARSLTEWSQALGISKRVLWTHARSGRLATQWAVIPCGPALHSARVVLPEDMEKFLESYQPSFDPTPPGWEDPDSGWLKLRPAAVRAGRKPHALSTAIGRGKLKARVISVGNRPVKLVHVQDLEAWLRTEDQPQEPRGDGLLLLDQAAVRVGVGRTAVRLAMVDGTLPARKEATGRNKFRFLVHPEDLDRWAEERRSREYLSLEQMVILTGLPAEVLRQGPGPAAHPSELESWLREHLVAQGRDPGPGALLVTATELALELGYHHDSLKRAVHQGRIRGCSVLVKGHVQVLISRLGLEAGLPGKKRR